MVSLFVRIVRISFLISVISFLAFVSFSSTHRIIYISINAPMINFVWLVVGVILFAAYTIAICYRHVWYKRPSAIECSGFRWWIKVHKNKATLIAAISYMAIPIILIIVGGSVIIPNVIIWVIVLAAIPLLYLLWLCGEYRHNKKALRKEKELPATAMSVKKRTVSIIAIASVAYAIAVSLYAWVWIQTPLQPLWATRPEFRNHDTTTAPTNTDGALANALWDARFYVPFFQLRDVYQEPRRTLQGLVYPRQPHFHNRFMSYFLQGFYDDSLSQLMPFSFEFVEYIMQDVNVYFATRESTDQNQGHVRPNLGGVEVFISTTGNNTSDFVFLSLHEIGHVFGLGESLSYLFAEEFLGLSNGVYDGVIRNFSPVLLPPYPITAPSFAWDMMMVYRSSTFDRALLRKLEAQNRADEFWYAAFHSNAEYARLWDRYMSEHMTFWEMQTLRSVDYVLLRHSNPHLIESFYSYTGNNQRRVTRQMLENWHTLMDTALDCEETRAQATQQFHEFVTQINSFAQSNNIRPMPAVFDFFLRQHHFRYQRDYGSTARGLLGLLR